MAALVRHLVTVDVTEAAAGALEVALHLESSLDYAGRAADRRDRGLQWGDINDDALRVNQAIATTRSRRPSATCP